MLKGVKNEYYVTNKDQIKKILKDFETILSWVESDKLPETYPAMYKALEKKGLIPKIEPNSSKLHDIPSRNAYFPHEIDVKQEKNGCF